MCLCLLNVPMLHGPWSIGPNSHCVCHVGESSLSMVLCFPIFHISPLSTFPAFPHPPPFHLYVFLPPPPPWDIACCVLKKKFTRSINGTPPPLPSPVLLVQPPTSTPSHFTNFFWARDWWKNVENLLGWLLCVHCAFAKCERDMTTLSKEVAHVIYTLPTVNRTLRTFAPSNTKVSKMVIKCLSSNVVAPTCPCGTPFGSEVRWPKHDPRVTLQGRALCPRGCS